MGHARKERARMMLARRPFKVVAIAVLRRAKQNPEISLDYMAAGPDVIR
jgi:hypothetical protein